MLGQTAAMNMQMIVGSLLIYRLTNSAAILGAMSFANAVPQLILVLYGGVIADRVQKKYVVVFGQAAFAIASLGVALALTSGYLSPEHPGSWWVLVVSAMIQGAVMGIMMPSRQAIIPEIVGEEQLMNAISLNTMGMNALQLFAPAAAGFLVDAFGFKSVYFTMTAAYAISIIFFTFLPRSKPKSAPRTSAIAGIKEGLKYVAHDTTILFVLLFSLLVVFLSMPVNNLMPIFVDDVLHVGAKGMGILMSVSGAGAMAGSIVLASLPNKKRGLIYILSSLVVGIALVGFSFSRHWTLSLILMIFIGLGQTGRMTLSSTLLQYYVKSEYIGRVMSLFVMQFGLTSFSAFAAGLMTGAMGIQWAVGSLAIALVALVLLTLVFIPQIRKLD
jgi:MFS family permease